MGQAAETLVRVQVDVHPIYETINFVLWNKDCFGRKVLFYHSY